MILKFADPAALSAEDLEQGRVLAPRFNSDGLVTAVAVEAETGRVLMLAHMNAEALSVTIETGEAHYYSRSRGRLWKKGESSGEVQQVRDILVDCDQDAVVLVVAPTGRGAACHTGRKSCFYRRVVRSDDGVRLDDLGDAALFDPREVYSQ